MQNIKKNRRVINSWAKFLQTIETEGGQIFVLLLLILMFAGFVKLGFKDAESQLYFILGALVGILKAGKSQVDKDENTIE